LNAQKTLNALGILHQQGLLEYLRNQSKPAQIRLNLSKPYESLLEKEDGHLRLIKTLVRSYGGIGDFYTKVDLNILSKRMNQPKASIIKSLEGLEKRKLLWFKAPHEGESVVFLKDRENPKHFRVDKKLHTSILNMRQNKFESLKRFVLEKTECRNKLLLAYFDEELETDCGNCDNCLKRNPVDLKQLILQALKESLSPKELLSKLPSHLEKETLELLRTMLELDEIKKEGSKLRKS
jgi:ATP-dependent DNA helicase RecQ